MAVRRSPTRATVIAAPARGAPPDGVGLCGVPARTAAPLPAVEREAARDHRVTNSKTTFLIGRIERRIAARAVEDLGATVNLEMHGLRRKTDRVVTIKRYCHTIFVMRDAEDPACAGRRADLAWLDDESLGESVHGLPVDELAAAPREQLWAIRGGTRPGSDELRIDRGGEADARRDRGREPRDKNENDWPNPQRKIRRTDRKRTVQWRLPSACHRARLAARGSVFRPRSGDALLEYGLAWRNLGQRRQQDDIRERILGS
jgi:hypothetical protein